MENHCKYNQKLMNIYERNIFVFWSNNTKRKSGHMKQKEEITTLNLSVTILFFYK